MEDFGLIRDSATHIIYFFSFLFAYTTKIIGLLRWHL